MHPSLIKLLALNKGRGKFRAETSADSATIYLYDVIVSDSYWGGVDPISFAKQLLAIDAPTIHLRINSPGGDVFAARAMEQAIRQHPSNIIAHIDGYAASAASYLALAADSVEIAAGGFFMIHKAWTVAFGNADELTKTADLLTKIDESLVNTYVTETGQDAQQVRDWMAAETWFTAEEAVQYGFADNIAQAADKSASNAVDWDFSAYGNAPIAAENEDDSDQQDHQDKERPPENYGHLIAVNINKLRLATAKVA